MAEYIESTNGNGNFTYDPGGPVSLESILRTEELRRRPIRPPDHVKENRALVALGQALADSPHTVLQALADTILDVCQAGSAGISLLATDDNGKSFYWPAIAGGWKSHIGGGTPRDFGPCGDVLDRNTPLLFTHVERRYTYFQPVKPPVEEALLVPFYVGGKAVGTIWAVAHDDSRKFDAEDERIMSSLGKFASSAYQVVASLDALKFQVAEREKAEASFRRSGIALRDFIETATIAMHWVGPDGTVVWVNQAELDMLGYARDEYIGHHIAEFHADQPIISDILARLARGETLQNYEAQLRRKDGSIRHVLINSTALFEDGLFVHTRCFTRDITERRRAEVQLRESEGRLRTLTDGLEAKVRTRTQELEQRNAEVLQQTEQLRELSIRLLQSQDDERRRIARDLHDSAGQIVTALGMNLARIAQRAGRNAEIGKTAEESRELVHQLSNEIRTLSYLLHPPLLDETGLSEAIRWYAQGLAERSGLKIELGVPEGFGRLSDDMEVALFRIVQECLTNIHRHSGSKTATIRLSRNAGSAFLEIQDDGTGISGEKLAAIQTQRSGVGITGMRERVRHLKGVMDIESNTNGTKISVAFPIPATATSETQIIAQRASAAE